MFIYFQLQKATQKERVQAMLSHNRLVSSSKTTNKSFNSNQLTPTNKGSQSHPPLPTINNHIISTPSPTPHPFFIDSINPPTDNQECTTSTTSSDPVQAYINQSTPTTSYHNLSTPTQAHPIHPRHINTHPAPKYPEPIQNTTLTNLTPSNPSNNSFSLTELNRPYNSYRELLDGPSTTDWQSFTVNIVGEMEQLKAQVENLKAEVESLKKALKKVYIIIDMI